MLTVIKLRTDNDRNGNPRRLFLVFCEGSLMRGYDEGGEGEHVMPKGMRRHYAGEVIDVAPSEWHSWEARVNDMMARHKED